MASEPLNIGVLISGSGTNLQAIIDAIANDGLAVRVVKVVSSRPDAYGLKRAAQAGIPTMSLDRSAYVDPLAADAAIAAELLRSSAQYVAMAGYMRKLTAAMLDAFPNRILNLHPALLPAFPGAHGIDDAFNFGVKVTGITVHFANAEYDQGPIIAQRAVPVREDDTVESLEERIHAAEHELYPWVLAHLAAGDISIGDDGKVHVANA